MCARLGLAQKSRRKLYGRRPRQSQAVFSDRWDDVGGEHSAGEVPDGPHEQLTPTRLVSRRAMYLL